MDLGNFVLTFAQRHNVVGLFGRKAGAQSVYRHRTEAVDGERNEASHLVGRCIGASVDAGHLVPRSVFTDPTINIFIYW